MGDLPDCFQPNNWIHKEAQKNHGYELSTNTKGVMNVITTPFADDFNFITNNKAIHQQLLSDVEEKIKSMGLVLKAIKCRSLSIVEGKTVDSPFYLEEKTKQG